MNEDPGFLQDRWTQVQESLAALGPIDALCLGIVAIFAIRGFFKGFVRQLALLAAIFGGLALANSWAAPIAALLPDPTTGFGDSDRLFLGYVAVFLGVLLAAALAAHAAENLLDQLQLRSLDRLMGFCLGGLSGAFLASVFLALGVFFTPRIGPGEQIHQSLENSLSLRWVATGLAQLEVAFPQPFVVHAQDLLDRHEEEQALARFAAENRGDARTPQGGSEADRAPEDVPFQRGAPEGTRQDDAKDPRPRVPGSEGEHGESPAKRGQVGNPTPRRNEDPLDRMLRGGDGPPR